MYDDSNTVTISGVAPDTKPTKLTAAYAADSTGALTVESGSQFFTFENVGVGTTNAGYIQIGDEIIGFTTATGSSLEELSPEELILKIIQSELQFISMNLMAYL